MDNKQEAVRTVKLCEQVPLAERAGVLLLQAMGIDSAGVMAVTPRFGPGEFGQQVDVRFMLTSEELARWAELLAAYQAGGCVVVREVPAGEEEWERKALAARRRAKRRHEDVDRLLGILDSVVEAVHHMRTPSGFGVPLSDEAVAVRAATEGGSVFHLEPEAPTDLLGRAPGESR